MKWSKEEDVKLQKFYPDLTMEELLKIFPNRTRASINIHASKLGLKKSRLYYNNNVIKADLSVLLNESYITYYWTGFIMGDGCITKTYRLSIDLQYNDNKHLDKFKKYVNYQLDTTDFKIQDIDILARFMIKFDLHFQKTYNPPNLNNIVCSYAQCMSMFIGLLDADGSPRIQSGRNDVFISFKSHASWLDFYKQLHNRLFGYGALPYIANDGYMVWNIGSYRAMSKIKQYIDILNLPVLGRKHNLLLKDRRLSV